MSDNYSFDKEKHCHTLDGKPLNGVTTVLQVISKPALIPWAVKTAVDYLVANYKGEFTEELIKEAKASHRKKKEEAGEKGTNIHEEIEILILGRIERSGGMFKGDEKSDIPQIQNFINWAVENKVKFLESEKHVYSREHWIGGIVDFVCEIDGKVYVGDIKTSSGIYPEAFLQMGAYALMLKERELYTDIKGLVVVNLKKDGTIQTQNSFAVEENQESFLAALRLYRALEFLK